LVLSLAAFLAHIAIMPFTQVDNADAVTRIYMAWDWLNHPEPITSGVWPPLHFYLLGLALRLIPDPIWAPTLLTSLLASIAVVPFYYFVKYEFGERVAPLAAFLYLVYPVVLHNSFIAQAEIPFLFFLLFSLFFIAFARRHEEKIFPVILAGVFLTLAGAIRYEAWMLTPLLCLAFWAKWKHLVVFVSFSLLFPLFWLSSHYLQFGDPLYFMHERTIWVKDIEGYGDNVSLTDWIDRLTFYPLSLFFGLTPVIAVLAIAGMLLAFAQRRFRLWGFIALSMLGVIYLQVLDASLIKRTSYTIYIGVLCLPFAAFAALQLAERLRDRQLKTWLFIGLIVTAVPLSFLERVPVLARVVPTDIQAFPRVGQRYEDDSRLINLSLQPSDGLVLDFFGWTETYYLSLMSRRHPADIFIAPGGLRQQTDPEELANFYRQHPEGVLVVANSESKLFPLQDGRMQVLAAQDLSVIATDMLGRDSAFTIYRYRVA
jgi:4-amino-4-deoxy-L-arabinose transferase-like glycosyltransferase